MIFKKVIFFIFGFLWKTDAFEAHQTITRVGVLQRNPHDDPIQQKAAGENKKNGAFLTFPSSFVKTQFWQLVLARASRRVPRAAVGASEVMDYSWDVQGKWHSPARCVAHSAAGRHDRGRVREVVVLCILSS